MNEKWKDWRKRLPRLSRGQKIVRNLCLSIPLALFLWGMADYPLPTARMEFCRLERILLLPPSQIVAENRSEDGQRTAYLSEGEDWIIVGSTTAVESGHLSFPKAVPCIDHLLPKEGIVLVALPAANKDGGITAAVWGAPEEAVSRRLEVDLIDVDGGVWDCPEKETVSDQNPRREGDWLFFELACDTLHSGQVMCAIDGLWEWDARILCGCVGEHPYCLTLTDRQGRGVVSKSGTLPPRQLLYDR